MTGRSKPDTVALAEARRAAEVGNFEAATRWAKDAAKLAPHDPAPYLLLGDIELACSRYPAASKHYREALRRQPDLLEGHGNLGLAWLRQGEFDKAAQCFERVLRLQPGDVAALLNSGYVAQAQGKTDAALGYYRQAINAAPDQAEAYNNAAVLHFSAQDYAQAIDLLRQAIRIAPDYVEAHNNLGNALRAQGQLGAAIESYRIASGLHPEHAGTWNNLGNALVDCGELEQGIAALRHAVQLKPDYRAAFSNWLMALNYLPDISREEVYRAHAQFNRQFGVAIEPIKPRKRDAMLRIGYVSPDFRMHSVAYFIEPILAAHDAAKFTVFCYADVPQGDAVTARMRGYAVRWRDIHHLSDQALCKRIAEDRIDILVDLAGHSSNNRLGVFAAKPAPIQVSYLGYPNTTGLTAMDYRFTDAWCDPEGLNDAYYSEKLIRLPHGFLCYRPEAASPPVSDLPALERGYVTFGSFNNLSKVTQQTIALWSQVLHAVANSRLILKAKVLADVAVRERIAQAFSAQGIDSRRVELRAQQADKQGHMAAYQEIDIALDTFPYHGTTTSFEALWMGVPLISLAGQAHASRVGVSILTRLGMPELIAATPEEYVAHAVNLASDLPGLQQVRQGMRQRLVERGLSDEKNITRDLEAAYIAMWNQHAHP